MNTKICTSIEQSEKLLSLGLEPGTADMFYVTEIGTLVAESPYDVEGCEPCVPFVPAWSLTALLELMPLYNGTTPRLSWCKGLYTCFYYQGKMISNPNSMVDAAFEMVCWLIEQEHIKVNK